MLSSLLLNNLSRLVALPSEPLASAQHEVDYTITHLPTDPSNVATDPLSSANTVLRLAALIIDDTINHGS
ncbi:hypothetical protein MTO96_007192 [Rhipicephalus appendiculatus]